MRKLLSLVIAIAMIVSTPTAFSATPKIGGSCTKINQFHESKTTLLVCATTKGKKTWRKATSAEKSLYLKEKTRLAKAAAAKVVPTPTPSPTPSPTPTPTPAPTPAWFTKVESVKPKELFSYQSFDNETIQLYPWEGKKVVVMTISKNLDPIVMGRILTALDMSYATYNELTNFTPGTAKSYNGKLLIAEIPQSLKSCGAGCGYLGATGIQIYDTYFQKLYAGVKNKNQFDQVLFYELGRNFWDYSNWNEKLAFKENDSVVTGFAVLMRFVTMAENDIPLSDFESYTGVQFLETVRKLAEIYLSNPNFSFSNTFAIQKSPGELSTTDLWASIMMDFAKRYGEKNFYTEFFKSIQALPQANTTLEAVKNWETALSKATKTDLSNEFANTWKMYK